MAENPAGSDVIKVSLLVGSSPNSWEEAAATALKAASKYIPGLRQAKIQEMDMLLGPDGTITAYRSKFVVSYPWHGEEPWHGDENTDK